MTLLEPSRPLTQFAVAYRYPEEESPPELLTKLVCGKYLKIATFALSELTAESKGRE
jgi:hypothetical protein